jgi:hypothetical protein
LIAISIALSTLSSRIRARRSAGRRLGQGFETADLKDARALLEELR